MNPFITVGSRTTCKKCDGSTFVRLEDDEDGIKFPICKSCGGRPRKYRVAFYLPDIGTNKFKKLQKSKNEVGESLDTLTKAKAFMGFLENKIKLEGVNFDPREIGSEKERRLFVVKTLAEKYLEHCSGRVDKNDLTPGGFRKIERTLRLYIIPLFGDYHIKQVTHQAIVKELVKGKVSASIQVEVCKILGTFLRYAEKVGLIKSVPTMPKAQRQKTFKVEDFYTAKERDLVVNSIKNKEHKIAITMLAAYVARVSEIRCLRWSDIDLKRDLITFSRHLSEGKTKAHTKEIKGLKSSPDSVLVYPLFPGLKEMLMQLGISFDDSLIFKG